MVSRNRGASPAVWQPRKCGPVAWLRTGYDGRMTPRSKGSGDCARDPALR